MGGKHAFLNGVFSERELDFCFVWIQLGEFWKRRPTIEKRNHFVGCWMWMMVTRSKIEPFLLHLGPNVCSHNIRVIFGVALFERHSLGGNPGHWTPWNRTTEELRPGRLTLGCRGAGQRNREALPNRSLDLVQSSRWSRGVVVEFIYLGRFILGTKWINHIK